VARGRGLKGLRKGSGLEVTMATKQLIVVEGTATAQAGSTLYISFDLGSEERPEIGFAELELDSEERAKELFGKDVRLTLEVI
jgi:hypothetical protein